MHPVTITLLLLKGDAKSLRTAEISSWNGKAIAAPRIELDEFLLREEASRAGVYILTGINPVTNSQRVYVGEAECIRDRLKQHKTREFWVSVIAFVTKDESLTKAHIKFLEGKLIEEATAIGKFELDNGQISGAKLPESDRATMEVFLSHIRQLLPILGSDLLVPIRQSMGKMRSSDLLFFRGKYCEASGQRTANGFAVLKGSRAVLDERPALKERFPHIIALRKQLQANGTLVEENGKLSFAKDHEFSSPTTAASVISGNGGGYALKAWKTKNGISLKKLDETI